MKAYKEYVMEKISLHRRGVGGVMCLVLVLSFTPSLTFAQQGVEVPQTVEGAKAFGLDIVSQLPQLMSDIFHSQVVPLWEKIFDWLFSWLSGLWESTLKEWIQGWIDKVKEFLGQEIEARKPGIQQSLKEEKQQLKEDLDELSLWERIRSLIFD